MQGVCAVVYVKSAVVYDLIIISCLNFIGCCGEGQTHGLPAGSWVSSQLKNKQNKNISVGGLATANCP